MSYRFMFDIAYRKTPMHLFRKQTQTFQYWGGEESNNITDVIVNEISSSK